jgi:hypothetical protein
MLSRSQVQFITPPFTSHGKLYAFGAQKPISRAIPAHFEFFTINFIVWSRILSIG